MLKDISFAATTLWMQIHKLPPEMVHAGMAERIGNRVGTVLKETLNKWCVVAHIYLRLRVNIPMTDPLPAGFLYDQEDDKI